LSIEKLDTTATIESAQINLQPAYIDFTTTKTQMTIGVALCVVACLAAFWSTLFIGFLHDDLLHLDYVARAFHGNWSLFLSNFTSNWAGSDLMRSYRPVTSLSFLIDYFLYQTNAVGFHLTNILLYAGCSALVGLITLEITGKYGNRLGAMPAVWAGLLFAVYPLHGEAVAWIVGRVDVLCTFFYLLSIWTYCRFRLLREKPFLWWSLGSFALAMLSKEMAVTLPAVIAAAEVLLFNSDKSANSSKRVTQRVLYVAFFWALFVLMATIRSLLIGTVVGGYGDTSILASLRNFFDKATLLKLFFPLNEEVVFPSWVKPVLSLWYSSVIASFAARLLLKSRALRPAIFLILWMVIAAAPTFQIWHIYPNLVGSRLFFLSSAPLCILIALSAFPTTDTLKRKFSDGAALFGTATVTGIFIVWSLVLLGNLEPWQIAGRQMSHFRQELARLASETAPPQRILLVDLPTDYSGAPMLTRELYLKILANRPFQAQDLAERFETIEPPIGGSHEFLWPRQYEILATTSTKPFLWDKVDGRFVPIVAPEISNAGHQWDVLDKPAEPLAVEPASVLETSSSKWKTTDEKQSSVTRFDNYVRVYPGKQAVTVWLPPSYDLDPAAATVASIALNTTAKNGTDGKLSLVWDGIKPGADWKRETHGKAPLPSGSSNEFLVWLGRYRDWTLCRKIVRIGLRCEPGDYYVDLRKIRVTPDDGLLPHSTLVPPVQSEQELDVFESVVDDSSKLQVAYNVSQIAGAVKAKIVCTKPGTTFDANTWSQISSPSSPGDLGWQWEATTPAKSGTIALPRLGENKPAVYQIRVFALNSKDEIIGLPGEPMTVEVKK
jgi:hypothetical protein